MRASVHKNVKFFQLESQLQTFRQRSDELVFLTAMDYLVSVTICKTNLNTVLRNSFSEVDLFP